MKITNENQILYFKIFFILLMMISLFDFLEARSIIQTGIPVWGHLYVASISFMFLLFFIMGRPAFTIDTQLDIIEVYSGLAFTSLFNKVRWINMKDFEGYEIKKSFMNVKLILYFMEDGEQCYDTFSLSYLSEQQIANIEKDLKRSYAKAQSGDLLFA